MKRHLSTAVVMLYFGAMASAMTVESEPVFAPQEADEVELGWLLFYDPILSGNRNISCATCHHPSLGTADGVALSIGEGGIGLGQKRHADPANLPEQRIPRNAPALFNLGASEFQVMFHDGRLEADPGQPGGMRTPLGADMVTGFDSVLSAQAMFPVLSTDEMAGHYSENEIATAVRLGRLTGAGGAWDLITQRIASVPDYQDRFAQVLGADAKITFPDIANAIAAFIATEWRADQSTFDLALSGATALPDAAQRGHDLFYGAAQCSGCHSGRFQTDHRFHAIGVPQFGPGKAARFENHARDVGRGRVTGNRDDFYRFRTPSLRNITLTAPYGHNGAYTSLREMFTMHAAADATAEFDPDQVLFPVFDTQKDWVALQDLEMRVAINAAKPGEMPVLSDTQIDDLIAFLDSLTDTSWTSRGLGIPETVPSGLPVDR